MDAEPRDAWLSTTPPADPLPALRQWLAEARADGAQRNPDAVTLATADADGRPAARIVLCRAADWERGWLGFYTNLEGAKARALAARPFAALTFYWDALDRQARVEGPVTRAPDEDADAYFATRPQESQLAAWASAQGEPLASRAALLARYAAAAARFGSLDEAGAAPIPRPHRLHDRVAWTRKLTPDGDGYRGGPWRAARLMP